MEDDNINTKQEDVLKVLANIQHGDRCKIEAGANKYPGIRSSGLVMKDGEWLDVFTGEGKVTLTRDGKNILIRNRAGGVYQILCSDITSIHILKRAQGGVIKISQQEARQICKQVIDEYYTKVVSFILGLHIKPSESALMFSGVAKYDFILSLINRLTGLKGIFKPNDYKLLLKSYLGDNIPSDKIIEIVDKCIEKYEGLLNSSAQELYQSNKEVFVETAMNVLLENSSKDLIEASDMKCAIDELKSLKNIEKILRLIYTYSFTNASMKAYKKVGFIDYTYISVSMFKLTEIVFNEMLNRYWADKIVVVSQENESGEEKHFTNSKTKIVDFSNEKLVLGQMRQFLETGDKDIVNHLKFNKYKDKLDEKLGGWTKKTRNGYLHKDILDEVTLDASIRDSIDVMILAILVVKR